MMQQHVSVLVLSLSVKERWLFFFVGLSQTVSIGPAPCHHALTGQFSSNGNLPNPIAVALWTLVHTQPNWKLSTPTCSLSRMFKLEAACFDIYVSIFFWYFPGASWFSHMKKINFLSNKTQLDGFRKKNIFRLTIKKSYKMKNSKVGWLYIAACVRTYKTHEKWDKRSYLTLRMETYKS